ncbi:MAG: TonB-dependent receptor [Flavisolibacter sp.]|nr:TonB-dependent receptor [Flavisolibacter sp.]
MRKILSLSLLAFCLNGFAQTAFVYEALASRIDLPAGMITGTVSTTDNEPAAFVTVHLKGTNKATITDEHGNFVVRNLKEGTYTVEVSMVGLKPQERIVEVKKDESIAITITLSEDARKLSEIIITSGRRLNDRPVAIGKVAIDPMDLPQSIAIIGQGLIREQQALRLSDVIKNVNGVYLSTTRGNVQESFSARGYSFGSNNLFKNGARINSGAMPEMSSLERVEVLKGSAAILFGQVAPGGIVNLVTKEPKFKSGGEVSMRIGSYDLYKPSVDFYGPLSSSIAYRINGTFETANSFRHNVSSKRYYVNPSFLFKISDKTELLVEGDYLHHRFTPDFGIGSLDNTKIAVVPRSRFMGTSWQYNTTQQTTATATLKHGFNEGWKLNTSLSYQLYKRDYFSVERIQAAANGDWIRPLGKIISDETYYTGQVNLTGKFATGKLEHALLTGIDADHYLTSNNDFSFPPVAGLPAGSYDRINILDPAKYAQRTDIPSVTIIRKREAPVDRIGAYVQDLVKLSDKFNVLAGFRWSYISTAGIDSTNLLTGAKTTGKTKTDIAFSPRLGLVYKPATSTSFFASYANSFNINTGQDVEGNAITASVIDQYEIGVKNELFNGALSANVTAYRILNNNLAQTAPFLADGTPNNNSNIKVLTGQTTSDGVEIDLAAHPLNSIDIRAGYSYNFTRYTKTADNTGSFKTGERLVNNPAHTANGSVFYTFNTGALKGFKAGASVFYIGERFGGWNNTVGQLQGYSRLIPVDGFTTIDVSAGYTYKKVSLLAKVSNLTNTFNYYVHENYSINPIAPAQFIATASYKF